MYVKKELKRLDYGVHHFKIRLIVSQEKLRLTIFHKSLNQ